MSGLNIAEISRSSFEILIIDFIQDQISFGLFSTQINSADFWNAKAKSTLRWEKFLYFGSFTDGPIYEHIMMHKRWGNEVNMSQQQVLQSKI